MILVTGAAGFIGANLVHALSARQPFSVFGVDNMSRPEKFHNIVDAEVADFADKEDFLVRLKAGEFDGKFSAVLHQGACSNTMETDGRYMLSVNYEYSKRLLGACLGRCPFIYASSAAVYGNGDDGFREEPECEHALNVYAYSKVLFDRHVRRVLPWAPTQVAGLRYFNVYGPQENHKGRMASVVYKFHHQIAEHGELQVFAGSEDFRRDFIFVDDAVDVNLFFLEHPEARGIFNCGTGRAESFLALAAATAAHYEGCRIVHVPFPESLVGKYQAYTQADLTRLRDAGYARPFTSLSDGVAAYVKILKEGGGYHCLLYTSPSPRDS